MQATYFRFQIEPWIYRDGTHVLRITMRYKNRDYQDMLIMPNQLPFESEIEYFTRIAVEALKAAIKEETKLREHPKVELWPPMPPIPGTIRADL